MFINGPDYLDVNEYIYIMIQWDMKNTLLCFCAMKNEVMPYVLLYILW